MAKDCSDQDRTWVLQIDLILLTTLVQPFELQKFDYAEKFWFIKVKLIEQQQPSLIPLSGVGYMDQITP